MRKTIRLSETQNCWLSADKSSPSWRCAMHHAWHADRRGNAIRDHLDIRLGVVTAAWEPLAELVESRAQVELPRQHVSSAAGTGIGIG